MTSAHAWGALGPLRYGDYVHPRSAEDVVSIVKNARAAGAQVRVRGSMHSEEGSILGDGFSRDGRRRPVVHVMLDRLTDIRDAATPNHVVVEAGVSLGSDPHAPGRGNPQSDEDLSLFRWLAYRGRALPITGGISHQTISGFLITGSAGGSLQRSLHDIVKRLLLVNGKGEIVELTPSDVDFPAALVSLGLFGIVCEVEIETVEAYGIRGLRSVQAVRDCDVDLFNDPAEGGRISLQDFLREKPVSRLMWWPQPGVQRVELWEATCDIPPPDEADRIPQTLGVIGPLPQLAARALYAIVFEGIAPWAGEGRDMGHVERGLSLLAAPIRMARLGLQLKRDVLSPASPTRIDRADAKALLDALVALAGGGHLFPTAPLDPRGVPQPLDRLAELRDMLQKLHLLGVQERVVALAIRLFVERSPRAVAPWLDDQGFTRRYTAQQILDTWQDGLPMDDPVHDRLLPVQFTELWLPIERSAEAMRALASHFEREGLDATGTFTIEVYGAKRSPAFMSAAYDQDVLRIDPFRYNDGDGIARDRFFSQFFEVLSEFEARFHWGKCLSPPWSSTGVDYRRSLCPKWDDFLALRDAYDPDDVFLTRYWAEHLGIVPSTAP